MTRGMKRLQRMRANPQGDWTIGDIDAVCREHGVRCDPPSKGSHYKITHPSQIEILTIPARRPIKPNYIRSLLAFLARVEEDGNEG